MDEFYIHEFNKNVPPTLKWSTTVMILDLKLMLPSFCNCMIVLLAKLSVLPQRRIIVSEIVTSIEVH